MDNSLRNLGIYNEFGDMSPTNDVSSNDRRAIVASAFENQINIVNNLFKAIVTTIKEKWSKFMAMIDDNMAKLKNRIAVTPSGNATVRIKQAFSRMKQIKRLDNPMKRVLLNSNAIFSKIRNVKDPQVIYQAKEQLKQQRKTQKNIIQEAKAKLAEAKKLLKRD